MINDTVCEPCFFINLFGGFFFSGNLLYVCNSIEHKEETTCYKSGFILRKHGNMLRPRITYGESDQIDRSDSHKKRGESEKAETRRKRQMKILGVYCGSDGTRRSLQGRFSGSARIYQVVPYPSTIRGRSVATISRI